MRTKIKVRVSIGTSQFLAKLGVNRTGDVQMFATNEINRNMTGYIPKDTGALGNKLKFVKSATEIEVTGPYARMQYYPWVMVPTVPGNGPFYVKGKGFRFRKGTILKPSKRVMKHPKGGPYWDKSMMAERGKAIAAAVEAYAKRKQVKV